MLPALGEILIIMAAIEKIPKVVAMVMKQTLDEGLVLKIKCIENVMFGSSKVLKVANFPGYQRLCNRVFERISAIDVSI